MSLNFPSFPSLDQVAYSGGVLYQWTGTKWKRLDSLTTSDFAEHVDAKTYTGTEIVLDTERANYHIIAGISEDTAIEVPASSPYDRILLEANLEAPVELWDIEFASYANKSFFVGTQEATPYGVFFRPDGKTVYIVGTTNDTVYQYTLSTPWDIATASYASKSFLVSGQDPSPTGIFFKPDGTTMYIIGFTNIRVYQYTLSTPWDIATASYASKSFLVSTQTTTGPRAMSFKSDGTAMYVGSTNIIFQYTLSTPWDIATASYANKSFNLLAEHSTAWDLDFKPDGTTMFTVDNVGDAVHQYTLSTPWDIATASYANKSFFVGTQEDIPYGVFFRPDGTTMYIVSSSSDTVYQYNLSAPLSITWSDNIDWADGTTPSLKRPGRNMLEFTPVNGRVIGKQIFSGEEV